MPSLIRDSSLSSKGKIQVEWAFKNMPVFHVLYKDYSGVKDLSSVRIAAALHVTKETGVLIKFLHDLGAEIALAGSNPLTTQDDVAAYLAEVGVNVFAWRGETKEEYFEMLNQVLDIEPMIVIDDGGDLHALIHRRRKEVIHRVIGGTEETTTGVMRLKAMEKNSVLKYPVIAVNDTPTKRLFDNKYGTGQSTIDGFLRATSILIAGKTVVVSGYGYVGRGVATRARGMGAKVVVTEVDPVKAIEAYLDGFIVMPMLKAAEIGDVFITCTGMKDVVRKEHMLRMKDGAFLANAGHFNVEINVNDLEEISKSKRRIRDHIIEYSLKNEHRLYLLGEGRLINLVAAEGHPPDIMMNSFANQFLSILYLLENKGSLRNIVYNVPFELDRKIAEFTLRGWGIEIDSLTEEQKKYGGSWII